MIPRWIACHRQLRRFWINVVDNIAKRTGWRPSSSDRRWRSQRAPPHPGRRTGAKRSNAAPGANTLSHHDRCSAWRHLGRPHRENFRNRVKVSAGCPSTLKQRGLRGVLMPSGGRTSSFVMNDPRARKSLAFFPSLHPIEPGHGLRLLEQEKSDSRKIETSASLPLGAIMRSCAPHAGGRIEEIR